MTDLSHAFPIFACNLSKLEPRIAMQIELQFAAKWAASAKTEGHHPRSPEPLKENAGKMGRKRYNANAEHLANIMAIMSATPITAYDVWQRTGIWKGAVRTTLAIAVLDGLITEIKGAGRVPSHYAKAGCDVIAPTPKQSRGKVFEYNGVKYPSQRAAAEAFGVDPSTLSMHLKNGTMHNIGTGCMTKPIEINGTTYRTRKVASLSLNVSMSTIGNMLHDGRARYAP